jgi:hypothetical protein
MWNSDIPSFHKIDWVDGERSNSSCDSSQDEVVDRVHEIVQETRFGGG